MGDEHLVLVQEIKQEEDERLVLIEYDECIGRKTFDD
jgi:hypothetical protein